MSLFGADGGGSSEAARNPKVRVFTFWGSAFAVAALIAVLFGHASLWYGVAGALALVALGFLLVASRTASSVTFGTNEGDDPAE